jgi:hypothetical protein
MPNLFKIQEGLKFYHWPILVDFGHYMVIHSSPPLLEYFIRIQYPIGVEGFFYPSHHP